MNGTKAKRIQIILTDEQYSLLQGLKGELGSSDSEVARNVILAWLAEKSFISTMAKRRMTGETR
jgi:hypothetical protein